MGYLKTTDIIPVKIIIQIIFEKGFPNVNRKFHV